MNLMHATRTIGHPTLRIQDIAPTHSPAYSPNLHLYLRVHGVFLREGGLLDAVYKVKPGTKAAQWFNAEALLIGHIADNLFTGSRLMSALCDAHYADRASYPCGVDGLELQEDFWERYLKVGRCAVDPAHAETFQGSRFDESDDARTCSWCGHHQRKVLVPRIVHDTTWISE
jgi:hypothetical protein